MSMLGGIAGSVGFFDFLEIVGNRDHIITSMFY
jgi:hypothetical protein